MSKSFGINIQKGKLNKGTMTAVDGGYWQVILGTLEQPNSTGALYDYESAVNVIERSRMFRMMLDQGLLKGELGHPRESESRDYNDFVRRIHTIDERNVCCHFRRVWIERNYKLGDGRTVIAILGEVCPSGPHAEHFRRSMENPHENVAFSVRSMTDDRIVNGHKRKFFNSILAWDVVTLPGLSGAHKFNSPSCESFEDLSMETVESVPFTEALLNVMRNDLERSRGIGMESYCIALESSIHAIDCNKNLKRGRSSLEQW